MKLRRTPPVAAVLVGVLALSATMSFAQESRTWPDTSTGTMEFAPVGTIDYSIGYASAGYDHFETEISVSWRDDGERTQLLFSGIQDKPPAKMTVKGNLLCVVAQYCARYQEVCSALATCYTYDAGQKQFVEEPAEGETVPR